MELLTNHYYINVDNMFEDLTIIINDKSFKFSRILTICTLYRYFGDKYIIPQDTWVVPKELIPIMYWLELPYIYDKITEDNVIEILESVRITGCESADLCVCRENYKHVIPTIIIKYLFAGGDFDDKLINIIYIEDFIHDYIKEYSQYLLDKLCDKLPPEEVIYWFIRNQYIGDYSKCLNRAKQFTLQPVTVKSPYIVKHISRDHMDAVYIRYILELSATQLNKQFTDELCKYIINKLP